MKLLSFIIEHNKADSASIQLFLIKMNRLLIILIITFDLSIFLLMRGLLKNPRALLFPSAHIGNPIF